jgi:subtilisin family serine protease
MKKRHKILAGPDRRPLQFGDPNRLKGACDHARHWVPLGAAVALLALVMLAMAGSAHAAQFHVYVRRSALLPANVTDALAAAAVESTNPSSVQDSPSLFLFDAANIEEVEQLVVAAYSADPGATTSTPAPAERRRAVLETQMQAFVSAVIPAHQVTDTVVMAVSWGLDRVNQRALPLDSLYSWVAGVDGTGVTAWVVDTGVESGHSEFASGRASNDFATYSPSVDCNGHGTHVSGTIGGNTAGIARGVRLRACKVLNCAGAGTTYTVAQGLLYVLNHLGSENVINLSLGYGARDSAIEAIINDLLAARVVVVAAAGNDSTDACTHWPSAQVGVVAVASSTSTDTRSSFSNFGSCVNLFAPGSYIQSAKLGGGYAIMSGTSMASPHVTGAIALIQQVYPGATAAHAIAVLQDQLTPDVISGEAGSPDLLLYTLPIVTPPSNPSPSPTRAPAGPTPSRSASRAPSPSHTGTKPPKPHKPSKSPTHTHKPKKTKPSKSGTKTPSRSARPRRHPRDVEESGGASLGPSALLGLACCALALALAF